MSDSSSPAIWQPLSQNSSFCRRVLTLWPTAGQSLLDNNRLHTPGVAKLCLAAGSTATDFDAQLREYRQTECLRIAWRDTNNAASLVETLQDLSTLAERCLQACVLFHWQTLQDVFGQPAANEKTVAQFCILGMGKLGGSELNFSSDIDLLFIFSGHGKTNGARRITCLDFFTRLARAIVHSLDTVTAQGQVYRIDTRLRPYGSGGKLVWSTAAMEQYYASEGRDWERYALLKARPIAGDLDLGKELLQELQPFIYRRYLDYGLFDGVRQLRLEIARSAAKQHHQDNLKLGPGGIREIEFLVQSLQLLRGGQHPGLRHHNLLTALSLLQQHQLLQDDVVELLRAAYSLLRRLENRLQMLDDQQQHRIPSDIRRLEKWSVLSGYPDSTCLLEELNKARSLVAEQFDVWFGDHDETIQHPVLRFDTIEDIPEWGRLFSITLRNHDNVLLKKFNASLARILKQPLSQSGRQRLQQLLPKLLSSAADTKAPGKSVLHGLTLLEKIAGRSNYLALLSEHPQALKRMLDYGAHSDWIAQQLQRQPALLDELIDPITLTNLPESRQAYIIEALALMQQAEQPLEQRLSLLQQWRQSYSLRIAANALFQQHGTTSAQWHLSCLAEACLHAINAIVCQLISSPIPLTIIAYGTLGAGEMHFASDLDLVFLYPDNLICPERNATRQAQKLIHLLTTIGPNSQLYEIDTRLRPNGQSGTLISSINAFHDYQLNNAWVWEWQALTRARCVLADDNMAKQFQAIRQNILRPARDSQTIGAAITEMASRLASKKERDSIALSRLRLQFLIQFWLLTLDLPDSPIPCNLAAQADWLATIFPDLKTDALLVAKNYLALQTYQQQQQLNQSGTAMRPLSTVVNKLWKKHLSS